MSDDDAGRVAKVVAKKAAERAKAPDVKSDKEFSALVGFVCQRLTEGQSFYRLIGERPYLATGRIDRLVATAAYVKPPVATDIAVAAKRAAKVERLSGAVAVLFMAVALATLGPWYALAVGVAVASAAEVYVQLGMPASIRIAAARVRLPRYFGIAALLALGYLGYEWLRDSGHPYLFGAGTAVAALLVAFIIPGLTLAVLVGRRERAWREGLERRLVKALKESSSGGGDR